jgi:queuine tRNA-ribosyltransferase
MTLNGRINLMNAVHAHDSRPIDENCSCYTCQHFTRAYLRHLIMAKEMLAATLVSIHNLHTLIDLMGRMRQAILSGCFDEFAAVVLGRLK